MQQRLSSPSHCPLSPPSPRSRRITRHSSHWPQRLTREPFKYGISDHQNTPCFPPRKSRNRERRRENPTTAERSSARGCSRWTGMGRSSSQEGRMERWEYGKQEASRVVCAKKSSACMSQQKCMDYLTASTSCNNETTDKLCRCR